MVQKICTRRCCSRRIGSKHERPRKGLWLILLLNSAVGGRAERRAVCRIFDTPSNRSKAKLREAEVALSDGQSVAHVCRALSMTEQGYRMNCWIESCLIQSRGPLAVNL